MFKFLRIISDFIVYNLFALNPVSSIAKSLHFLLYNTLKVYVLILIFGFLIGLARSFISPARTKKLLSKTTTGVGNILAVILAVITPVESFSVVPVFVGFLGAGIPLSIAFTYLIVAPITNEIAFALFLGFFGYKIALLYYGAGITVGLLGGLFIGALHLDRFVKPFVYSDDLISLQERADPSFKQAIFEAMESSFTFFKSFWLYILIGVGMASLVNVYMPKLFLIKYIGGHSFFAVPIVVAIVAFFYMNIAMAMPLILVFIQNGLPLGTVFAFTMAVTATSIPELFILKSALKWPLVLIYFIVLISSIIFAGIIINSIF